MMHIVIRKENFMENFLIIGAGVVGKATGLSLIENRHKTVFLDIDTKKVNDLKKDNLKAVSSYSELGSYLADIIMVCVPTPMDVGGMVQLDYLKESLTSLGKQINVFTSKNPLIVIRSTVPPTTTTNILIPLLESISGLTAGDDFKVCYQPEFLRASSSIEDSKNPWGIVIGEYDKASGDILEKIYNDIPATKYRVSIETAEMIKYISNFFNALKISFSNEIWLLGKKLGLDANKALEIASNIAEGYWNNGYGTVGGRPYGGSCLPKDTAALSYFTRSIGVQMPLLDATIDINSEMIRLATLDEALPAIDSGPRWKPSPMIATKIFTHGDVA